ncbi:MAG: MFS transporter, partial [Fimbriimonas ginsengisoli]|nr:MFS transporter [Fimbriimonas ginsengisoli]
VGPTYNEWLAEMVPADSRGVFFSRRNAILIATGALAALVGAVVLDLFRGAGLEAQGFSVVFGLGLACAGLSMGYYFKMFDLSRAEVRRTDFGQGVRELAAPLADRNFRRVLIFLAAFFVGQMFAGNLFSAFALETLRLPYTTIQGLSVLQAAGIVLAATAWGRLTDRHGTRPMLALSAAGIGLSPLLWLACRPGHDAANIAILAVGHLLIGLVWSGVGVCQFNILLATSPAKERATYLAAGFTVQTLLAGIAPILGAWMLTSMRGATSVEWAYKSVFLVTMAMRLSAVLLLVPVREEGSASIRSTARELLSKPGQTLRKTRAEKNEEPDDNPQIPA